MLAVGAAALAVGVWLVLRDGGEAEQAGGRPPFVLPVTTAVVERRDVQPAARLTGTVRAWRRASLAFEQEGIVEQLLVRAGDEVEAGTPLARLAAEELQLAVLSAEADLELARVQLERLEAGERDEEVARLAAEVDAARADEALAQVQVERRRKLAEEKFISAVELIEVQKAAEAAGSRREAAEQRLAAARAGTRAEDIAVQRARVSVADAALALARQGVADCVLVAPFDGTVARRWISEGDRVESGTTVFELVDTENLEVELEIPARDALRAVRGATVLLTRDEDPGWSVEALLDARIPVADERSRSLRGLVRLEGERAAGLEPGAFVRADLLLAPVEGALVVPADAVRTVDDGTVVVRALPAPEGEAPPHPGAPTHTADWVGVRLLGRDASGVAVEVLWGELAPDDRVVLTGVDLTFPGASLVARPGAPPQEAPADETPSDEAPPG
jgi:HlyD family secretion protein